MRRVALRLAAVALVSGALVGVAAPANAGIICPYSANAAWRVVFGENLCYA